MSQATTAQTFDTIIRHLQNEEMRMVRKRVFSLKNTEMQDWLHEDKMAVERFCHTYDSVGIMIRNGLIPKNIFLDNWGDSIKRGKPIVMPLIKKYRKDRNAVEIWDDYEWLAIEAEKHLKKIRKKHNKSF